jgi:hypothetical protein
VTIPMTMAINMTYHYDYGTIPMTIPIIS